jgi:nucleoside-diphosphate-sugar epimerase
MRVLLTGHAGYIGSVTSRVLREAGHEVVGIDTGFFAACGFPGPTPPILERRKDVRDLTLADLSGIDAVVHLAALCNDPLGDLDAGLTIAINYEASAQLARLARDAGVSRFVFASSCSMYGAAAGSDLLTESAPLRPLTAYAESKVRTEEALDRLADADFSPVSLRNATAYGLSPRLRGDVVLNNLVGWAHTTGRVRIMSDGTPWRPIVHVEDIARASAACLVASRERIHNQAFNVGRNDENYQVRDIAEIVRETVPGATIEYAGETGPDPRNYRVDFSKVSRELPEFQPVWTARRGAREVYHALHAAEIDRETFLGPRFIRLARIRQLRESGALDPSLRWVGQEVAS